MWPSSIWDDKLIPEIPDNLQEQKLQNLNFYLQLLIIAFDYSKVSLDALMSSFDSLLLIKIKQAFLVMQFNHNTEILQNIFILGRINKRELPL